MQPSNIPTVHRYLQAVSSLESADAVAAFYTDDFEFHEFPNRIAQNGRVRRGSELRDAFEQARKLLVSQTYDVKRVMEAGNEIAMEVEWTGVLAIPVMSLPAGSTMKAFIGMFLTFRDGKIASQRNYDCYPPFVSEPSA